MPGGGSGGEPDPRADASSLIRRTAAFLMSELPAGEIRDEIALRTWFLDKLEGDPDYFQRQAARLEYREQADAILEAGQQANTARLDDRRQHIATVMRERAEDLEDQGERFEGRRWRLYAQAVLDGREDIPRDMAHAHSEVVRFE